MAAKFRSRTPGAAKPESVAGPFCGTAQGGPARQKRAHALAEELLDRGNMFIQSQVWEEAEREFRKAIQMEPDYAEAYNNFGLCMLHQDKLPEAADALQNALKYLPGWHIAQANLALVYQRMQHPREAADLYKAVLAKKQEQPSIWLNYADALAALGQINEAVAAYQKAVELAPKFDTAYLRMGLLHARRNKIEEAKQALNRAVTIAPDNPEALAVLGAIAARQGDLTRARDYFTQVQDADPVPPPAVRGMARLRTLETAVKRCMAEWKQQIPQTDPLAVCWYKLGLAQINAGNENMAKEAFRQAVEAQPEWTEPLIWFGFFAALDGNAVAARGYWEKVLQLQPKSGLPLEQMGYLALAMGLQKDADAWLKKASELGRKIPELDAKTETPIPGSSDNPA